LKLLIDRHSAKNQLSANYIFNNLFYLFPVGNVKMDKMHLPPFFLISSTISSPALSFTSATTSLALSLAGVQALAYSASSNKNDLIFDPY
jgi:hypothetical protein